MKRMRLLLPVFLLSLTTLTWAQTTKPLFNDEDLKKYAITQDSIKDMQETLNGSIADMVQKSTVVKVDRYNALFKIIDDQAKLTEAKATPEEIAFVHDVAAKRKEGAAKITSTFQSLAKDYVGLKAFNAIKKSLTTDTALKEKYDALAKELETKSDE